ncbi:BTAD domain-containing putative transcriptional regulator [Streptomyces sp. NPDC001523]|uniref:BTAD domain-containing putative transcriptional regulator n=1 Tax=Streptomyces sp. NPDC001523 TaxID=3154383 RepID=UPI003322EBC3
MRIGMLGPLEVRGGDGVVAVGGARLRALLVLLALEPGRVVPSELLIDGIWEQDPPMGAANALQALVSRLRRALPGVEVESHPAGYRLLVEPEAVDVVRFERLVSAGRTAGPAGDVAGAARLLREALDLWRGPALLDVAASEVFRAPATRLTELRLAVLEERIEADLALGHGRELAGELAALVAEHPLREGLVGSLMRSLAAAGRPAEALAAYARAREALAEELGADPSPELAALHTALLRGEVQTPRAAPPAARAAGPVEAEPATNLRTGLASFVGRDTDIARVGELLGEFRLVTLTGPGGAGKTRLAAQAARPLLPRFPDGVWLVELAPLGAGADVPQAVLAALGLREPAPGSGDPLDRLVRALRHRTTLLLLDNCEHLVGDAAGVADRLLGECPGVRILATSREPLALTGEALWPLAPLDLPPRGADAAEAVTYPAVRLLAERAAAARSGFVVDAGTVGDVVRICHALDGMPLAIELAAARLRTMAPDQLATRLDDRFRVLTGGARTAPRQHRTLRAVVDWSWELLGEAERALLRRLAAFPGGATVEAVERVCAGGPVDAYEVWDLLTSLADKSLLVTAGDGRYRMLETIRAYGLERLDGSGEREAIRAAHAAWFAELAEAADPHLRRAGQLDWLARLSAEHDNLNAAVRGAVAAGDARGAVRLVAAAGWYWWLSGHKALGAELAAQAVSVPGESDTGQLALACALAVLLATAGVGNPLGELLERARELAERTTGGRHPLIRFLGPLHRLMSSAAAGTSPPADAWDELINDEDPWLAATGRLEGARTLLGLGGRPTGEAEDAIRTALAGFRATGERWGTAFSLTVLADLVAQRGDLVAALAYHGEAIAVVTEMGVVEDRVHARLRQAQLRWLLDDRVGSAEAIVAAERDAAAVGWPDAPAMTALAKGELRLWDGALREARGELEHAGRLIRELAAHPAFEAVFQDALGHLEAADGNLDAAATHRSRAVELALAARHAPTLAQVLVGCADQEMRRGRAREAAALLAAAVAVRGGPDHSRPDARRVEDAARAALGEEFAEAARCGGEATMGTARELVRDVR